MFDLTDDVENSPYSTKKVKPTEVKLIPYEKPKNEKDTKDYVNDETHEYDVHEDDTVEDKDW